MILMMEREELKAFGRGIKVQIIGASKNHRIMDCGMI